MNRSRTLFVIVILLLLGGALYLQRSGYVTEDDAGLRGSVEDLHRRGVSNVFVEVNGTVDRLLADDNIGSRHQRFILELSSGHTVLVSHNIDLAERVPLNSGTFVTLRGEYEWNDQGGVVHWTHHDPQGRIEGGWIEVDGVRYR